jgi:hypothetical protein
MSTNEEGTSGNNCLHECAAGAFCTAPPGTDDNASAHRCLDCRRKIHCALWCGENWGEYIELGCCKITPNRLSATGQLSMQGDHKLITICYMCLNRLEVPAPLIEPHADNNEQIASTIKKETKKPAVDWAEVIPTLCWKSLRVSASKSNPVHKGNQQRGNNELTRLEGVEVAEGHVIEMKGIYLDALQKIGVKMGLGQTRSAKKKRMCDILVSFFVNKEFEERTGVVSMPVDCFGQSITWNVTRYLVAIGVAGNEEGNGDFGKSDGDGDKGGGQATATATKRVIMTATRVVGWW